MVWKISALPKEFREFATTIDNDETIERVSSGKKGDGKLDDIEMQALFSYCKNNIPEYQNCSLEEFTSVFKYKPSKKDWALDCGGTLAQKAGMTYNLNPIRTLTGPENDSGFSKAARVMDPGMTTLLDNTKMSDKTKNTALWILNPIGKAVSKIFGG